MYIRIEEKEVKVIVMKITIIGYWHGYPEKGEATSGYLLEHEDWKVLLDCGSGVLSQLQYYCSLSELDAIVLSHYHYDHFADVGPFQYAQIIHKGLGKPLKEVTIYGHMDDPLYDTLSYKNIVHSAPYDSHSKLEIGPFTFQFIKTKHPVTCYAMKITCDNQTLVYTADTSYFEELTQFAQGANLLITECSGYAGDPVGEHGHMTSSCVGRLALSAYPQQLVLSHLPHHGDHQKLIEEVSKYYQGKITLAKSGLTIDLT